MKWIIEIPKAIIGTTTIIIKTVLETPKIIIKSTVDIPDSLAGCLGSLLIILLLFVALATGLCYISDKVETGVIKKIWPSYETRAEKALKEPVLVKKGLHSCQIVEIEFQKTDNKSKKFLGLITYLDENNQPNTVSFVSIRGTDRGVEHCLSVIDPNCLNPDYFNRYGQASIPFDEIQKIRFETIPYSEIKRWPSSFSASGTIPRVKTEVEYKNGITATYSIYATSWIYFSYYQKRL